MRCGTGGPRLRVAALAALALALSPAAVAMDSTQILERARELRELAELMAHEDPFVQRSAYRHLRESGDPDLLKAAIDGAFDGRSAELKTLALGDWLRQRSRFAVELLLPSGAGEQQKQLFEQTVPMWFSVAEVDDSELELRYRGQSARAYRGNFVPGGFLVTYSSCVLQVSVVDRSTFTGSFGCDATTPLPLTVDVY